MFRYFFTALFGGLVFLALGVVINAQANAPRLELAPTTAAPGHLSVDKAEPDDQFRQAASTAPAPAKVAATAGSPSASNPASSEFKLSRWFDLQTATISLRYHFRQNSQARATANQLQHNEAFKGRFKFDRAGRYSLNAGLFSGNHFIVSWNNLGVSWDDRIPGSERGVSNLYLKQLYFEARPVTGLELQYGGLYLLRGESTEVTSYDNDGYLVGQRLSVKRPKELFFDEVSVTYAYLGDLTRPNLTKRFHRLRQANYHQFLVSKQLGARAAVSADYTFQAGVETLREAIRFKTPELKVVDTVRFENYQRLDVKPDYGFALTGEKILFKRLTLNGGYASIDRNYGGLNADRLGSGKRVFLMTTWQLRPALSLASFVTSAVANSGPVSTQTRFEVIVSYNLLKGLQQVGLFR